MLDIMEVLHHRHEEETPVAPKGKGACLLVDCTTSRNRATGRLDDISWGRFLFARLNSLSAASESQAARFLPEPFCPPFDAAGSTACPVSCSLSRTSKGISCSWAWQRTENAMRFNSRRLCLANRKASGQAWASSGLDVGHRRYLLLC